MNNSIEVNETFALKDSQEYSFIVRHYAFEERNELIIEARNHITNHAFHLNFSNVLYFSGFLSCTGTKFHMCPPKELIEFLHSTQTKYSNLPNEEHLKDILHLFKFTPVIRGEAEITVIAATCYIHDF